MKKSIILIIAICSFLAANCQVVATVNDFEIIEIYRNGNLKESYFTVPKLLKYLDGKRIEISYSNEKKTVDEATFFVSDFQYSNLEITSKSIFIIVRTNECLIRFERDNESNFNVECNCQEL